jgi:DNA-binding FadR family transcriptional regulator
VADISHEDFAHADLGFHLAVAAAAGNPFFVSISTLIEVVLEAMLTISSPAANSKRHAGSITKHRHIAQAIATQDAAGARRAMQSVVQEGVDAIRKARS